MGKYLKPLLSVFGIALILSPISVFAQDGQPTRDINVRVIAICASPAGGEPHEGDAFKCLCFGGPLNGYNATMSPDGINCPRRTIGPFCFVTEDFMPLYWKETVRNQSGPTTVEPGGVVEARVHCPEGKMVLSCQGLVTVGDTNEPAANVASHIFPTADGLACRHVVRTDIEPCSLDPNLSHPGEPLDPTCDTNIQCVCDNPYPETQFCCTSSWTADCACAYSCAGVTTCGTTDPLDACFVINCGFEL
jgi:hypothetical protein